MAEGVSLVAEGLDPAGGGTCRFATNAASVETPAAVTDTGAAVRCPVPAWTGPNDAGPAAVSLLAAGWARSDCVLIDGATSRVAPPCAGGCPPALLSLYPTLEALEPGQGFAAGGATLTLTGYGFSSTQGAQDGWAHGTEACVFAPALALAPGCHPALRVVSPAVVLNATTVRCQVLHLCCTPPLFSTVLHFGRQA